jgi:hypothetical protein
LEGCGIATMSDDGKALHPGPRAQQLASAWARNDRTTVFWLLAPWTPLRAASRGEGIQDYGEATYQSARSIAASLGFVAKINREMFPGGGTPSMLTIGTAFRQWRSSQPERTVRGLLVDFLLAELQVSPSRVIPEWERLRLSGAFSGVTFRRGGHADQGPGQKVVDLTDLKDVEVPLDAIDGFRDFIPQEDA